jgi:hypothetical protein
MACAQMYKKKYDTTQTNSHGVVSRLFVIAYTDLGPS